MNFRRAFLAGAGLAAALIVPAAAQQAPQVTDHKEFGDWVVECYAGQATTPCSMIDVLIDNNSKQRVLTVALTYVPGSDRHILRLVVPLGISIEKGVSLSVEKFKSPTWNYAYCSNQGCFMQTEVDTATISALAHASERAKVAFVDNSNGKLWEVTFSLASFTEAHDLMVDWTRQKTKGSSTSSDAAAAEPAKPAKSGK